jgi:hypothetical protein
LQWKLLVYFIVILSILWPFGIFHDYLVYFSSLFVCCTLKNLANLLWIQFTSCFRPKRNESTEEPNCFSQVENFPRDQNCQRLTVLETKEFFLQRTTISNLKQDESKNTQRCPKNANSRYKYKYN